MSSPPPQVAVRGEARLVVDPEIATLAVTVTTRARDRQTALERCRAGQDAVAAVLAAAGASVEAVETAGLAVYPEERPGHAAGSAATVSSQVTVGRTDDVGELVVALGRLDGVTVSGPHWQLRPDSRVVEEARLAAVRDAVHRARQYAAAVGARLTALLEISDVGLSSAGPRFAAPVAALARFAAEELRLDLTPAPQEVLGAVEVRFAMSEPDREVFGG
ncbi:SIMPL domain-containing protein [Geodermatophilus sp. CPCC 206100]|uniref:SIMPL domain-containing protein n=1 Tax=Geodermatophilus sp. CPCC 206100 TaxID=3020054 RepID=UPI003B00CFB5